MMGVLVQRWSMSSSPVTMTFLPANFFRFSFDDGRVGPALVDEFFTRDDDFFAGEFLEADVLAFAVEEIDDSVALPVFERIRGRSLNAAGINNRAFPGDDPFGRWRVRWRCRRRLRRGRDRLPWRRSR